ncbi:MAG: putative HTH-type transcriptional regulator YqaE [Bacteroidia bacterium]|nr:MAG: putative HTH-type transcriptional regulator YqaE [Bacteroidia bacterium]
MKKQEDILHSKQVQKIFQNIRKIRSAKGLSQQNMADELGYTQKHYSNIENGNVDISITTLIQISEILEVSPAFLLGYPKEQQFFNVIHNQNGEGYCFYYATEVEQVKQLYERLLKEKDEVIDLLKKKQK